MSKIKERVYTDYDDENNMIEEEFIDSGIDVTDDEDSLLFAENSIRSKRTWRDTEKYKEMRELYKIINDELYVGFYEDEFDEENG